MKRTLAWQSLNPGDIVDVVAPGMPPLKGTLPRVKKFLKSWGLIPRLATDLVQPQLICANSESYRFQSLARALRTRDSKMVWCLRGGYGSIHLLPALKKLRKPPEKLFMGLSDITSLHIFLQDEWRWRSIHGSNVDRFAFERGSAAEVKSFKDLLFGKKEEIRYSLKALNKKAKASKKTRGVVTGGNLITLQSTLGTAHEIKTQGKILFIEDIGERAYRVDRVLQHLKQAGKFKKLKAIVLGQFTGGKEPNGKVLVPKLFKEFADGCSFPVFSGIQSGHGDPQRPLILGAPSTLSGGDKPTLACETGLLSE